MAYDIHITRAPEWWGNNSGYEISEAEWLAVVDADPDLRPSTPNDPYHSKNLVLWAGNNFGGPWLSWRRGNIYSKGPNGPLIEKMLAVATQLRAQVQGDDREIYLAEGRVRGDDGRVQTDVDWRKW